MTKYIVSENAPQVYRDHGAGPYCQSPGSWHKQGAVKAATWLATNTVGRYLTGPDAKMLLNHYLGNTGETLHVDMNRWVAQSPLLQQLNEQEISSAKEFARSLPVGRHPIASEQSAGGRFQGDEHNFGYAVGGFSYWGQGVVTITAEEDFTRLYVLDFVFHIFDRYNWDGDKTIGIPHTGTPWTKEIVIEDDLLADLHRHCYAQEFDVWGHLKSQHSWRERIPEPAHPLPPSKPRANGPFGILLD